MHGFINVRKEKGWTSHDVVARLRTVLGTRRLGHTGTLDPEVEGVLVVAAGRATKLIQYMEDDTKEYAATVLFGATSDTQDAQGTVIRSVEVQKDDLAGFAEALHAMRGELLQTPPMYSAVKIRGKKLYELARRGEVVERTPRRIVIHDNRVLKLPWHEEGTGWLARFELVCSRGTYVRTYCHDLAQRMGTIGLMQDLIRTRVGRFKLADALRIDEIAARMESGDRSFLHPVEEVFSHVTLRIDNPEAKRRVCHGNAIRLSDLGVDDPDRLVRKDLIIIEDVEDGTLALAEYRSEDTPYCIRMRKVFSDGDS